MAVRDSDPPETNPALAHVLVAVLADAGLDGSGVLATLAHRMTGGRQSMSMHRLVRHEADQNFPVLKAAVKGLEKKELLGSHVGQWPAAEKQAKIPESTETDLETQNGSDEAPKRRVHFRGVPDKARPVKEAPGETLSEENILPEGLRKADVPSLEEPGSRRSYALSALFTTARRTKSEKPKWKYSSAGSR